MSQLKVNSISDSAGANGNAITLASDGSCTAKITNNLSNRNLIINGAVTISQRLGTSNTTIGSGATYGPDRIAARTQTGSGHTLAQTADGPAGFKYSAKVTIGTGGSPSAANKNYLYQTIEGNNVAHLGSGTSSAETVTLSFWVKSSLTGNFGAAIVSGAADHSYTFPYTISSANTWEKKTKTIALPTSGGTWATDNSGGLMVMFDLGSGSDFEGTANQWNSAFDVRASSDVKLMATNSATWYVTGLQLEVGHATDFEHRSYGDELARSQRYFYMHLNPSEGGPSANYMPVCTAYFDSTTQAYGIINFPVTMNHYPDLYKVQGTNYFDLRIDGTSDLCDEVLLNRSTPTSATIYFTGNVSGTAGKGTMMRSNNSAARIGFDAEL